ncbi:aspartate aminotransferase family protein [Paenibacillus sp. GCM10027627]|uniref:aspartate aminotransferase family protein n=1 Tax=unclassified Paenibacillus TaxID=185978 RepID=UPI0036397C9A
MLNTIQVSSLEETGCPEYAPTSELLASAHKHVLFTANRPNVIMAKGEGMTLYDTDNKAYLDFIGGWAVTALGHSPAVLQEALAKQAATLVHASPAFYNKPQAEFSERLASISGMDRVFFTSTGAEANESAVKLARKHGALNLNGAHEIITLTNSFHGRTLAMMSATGKPHWKPLFAPKVDGFVHVPINDLDACFAAVTNDTCGIMVELVQGEGGVHPLTEAYLFGLRKICDMYGILLIFDEVQTGLGRTGKLFAHQHFGIAPDIMTLGKGIGGGFPLAAMLTKESYNLFEPGDQGGTYTGQPLAMAAGLAVVNELLARDLTSNAEKQGRYLTGKLEELSRLSPISNVRGKGLLLAFDVPEGTAARLSEVCMELGLLINASGSSSIRLMPALIVEEHQIDGMIAILREAMQRLYL